MQIRNNKEILHQNIENRILNVLMQKKDLFKKKGLGILVS